ncbi:hypothetical protein [Iodidimonas sp. SYSU 1G8]|uniref:hypothetical protein n=1 Tax=Iodidimonas sp. SYSU 1G8 TaxID=3133967 RepID=UPI0031FEE69C
MSMLSIFVLEPFQAELSETLASAPREVIAQVTTCLGEAPAALSERVSERWGWSAATALGVAFGMTSAESVVAEVVPSCGPAIAAARPYMG